jgi:glutamine synthetase
MSDKRKHPEPDPIALLDERLASYAERGVRQVQIGLTDLDGVLRGKYVSLDKFASLLRSGGGFCDCILGWDIADELYALPSAQQQQSLTGWHTGFPDARYRLLIDSERWFAEDSVPFFLGEFVGEEGASHPICPRSLYKRALERLASLGYELRGGFEYEFFVFDETPHSVRDKGYRNLVPITPGNFGYSVLRASTEAPLFTSLMNYCQDLALDVEGLHCETGPGVWEAALAPTDGLEVADRANLFKTFCKVFFQRRDMMATFMAKWSMHYPGQSGHFHFSLLDSNGANPFFDAQAPHGMSQIQRYAMGGLLQFLPQWLCLLAPTVNSYTRLVRGAWAPTAATWGVDNRTAALRVIEGVRAQRIECRIGGADANPYLVAAAVAMAAALGIEQCLEPGEPVVGNAYELEETLAEAAKFPLDLASAAQRLTASSEANDAFGSPFVSHFANSRRWEQAEHQRTVDDWQLERYFEIV